FEELKYKKLNKTLEAGVPVRDEDLRTVIEGVQGTNLPQGFCAALEAGVPVRDEDVRTVIRFYRIQGAELPNGLCAVSVFVCYGFRGPFDYAEPGQRVDVRAETYTETGKDTRILLKDVLVLANGGISRQENERISEATLLVKQEDVEMLRSATQYSILRLVKPR